MTQIEHQTALAAWMKRMGLRDEWLVGVLCISQPQASRLRRGRSQPTLEAAVTLERVTDGEVKPSDFVAATDPVVANDPDALPHSEAA